MAQAADAVEWGDRMPNIAKRFMVKWCVEDLQRSETWHVRTSTTGVLRLAPLRSFCQRWIVCYLAYSVLLFWFVVAIPPAPVRSLLLGVVRDIVRFLNTG